MTYIIAQKISNLLICVIFQRVANFLESYPQTYPQKMWVPFGLIFRFPEAVRLGIS
jgi:hypothetical protein